MKRFETSISTFLLIFILFQSVGVAPALAQSHTPEVSCFEMQEFRAGVKALLGSRTMPDADFGSDPLTTQVSKATVKLARTSYQIFTTARNVRTATLVGGFETEELVAWFAAKRLLPRLGLGAVTWSRLLFMGNFASILGGLLLSGPEAGRGSSLDEAHVLRPMYLLDLSDSVACSEIHNHPKLADSVYIVTLLLIQESKSVEETRKYISDNRTKHLYEEAASDATRLAPKARAASLRPDPWDQPQAAPTEFIGPAEGR